MGRGGGEDKTNRRAVVFVFGGLFGVSSTIGAGLPGLTPGSARVSRPRRNGRPKVSTRVSIRETFGRRQCGVGRPAHNSDPRTTSGTTSGGCLHGFIAHFVPQPLYLTLEDSRVGSPDPAETPGLAGLHSRSRKRPHAICIKMVSVPVVFRGIPRRAGGGVCPGDGRADRRPVAESRGKTSPILHRRTRNRRHGETGHGASRSRSDHLRRPGLVPRVAAQSAADRGRALGDGRRVSPAEPEPAARIPSAGDPQTGSGARRSPLRAWGTARSTARGSDTDRWMLSRGYVRYRGAWRIAQDWPWNKSLSGTRSRSRIGGRRSRPGGPPSPSGAERSRRHWTRSAAIDDPAAAPALAEIVEDTREQRDLRLLCIEVLGKLRTVRRVWPPSSSGLWRIPTRISGKPASMNSADSARLKRCGPASRC